MIKNIPKELREWIVLGIVGGGLYFTGYHTEVIGQIQRVLIMTGALQPDLEQEVLQSKAEFSLSFKDVNGVELQLSDYRGKTIFLNFWATWCPPCIAEMPDINNLYLEMNEQIVFLLISVDDQSERVWQFSDRKGFDYPLFHIEGRRPDVFKSTAIPTTFVIDPSGNVVMQREGMAKYNTDKFKDFLKRL